MYRYFGSFCALFSLANAQYFPPSPEGLTIVNSKINDGVTISYKQPGICETTPGVQSYAGYVHLPPGTLDDTGTDQDYPINTFFWYFESRKDPANAPLAIWLNGGPGASSMIGLLSENGPCIVNDDSNSTTLNQFSWNNEVNMLYIDQPVQAGLSYDTLVNATISIADGTFVPLESGEKPQQNLTQGVFSGTFSSGDPANTANTTQNAARAIWHFAQTWFQEFPAYKPNDNRINLFVESFGGHYGPVMSQYFETQNQKIANNTINSKDTFEIHLDTLGIINGCVDIETQLDSYYSMIKSNTYNITFQDISPLPKDYPDALQECYTAIHECRNALDEGDPNRIGANETVNTICQSIKCQLGIDVIGGTFDYYDFSQPETSPFPANYFIGYLNQPHVQAALGAPVNFSDESNAVYNAFSTNGYSFVEQEIDSLNNIASLLDEGVKVALIYGDRDYICNWVGGENVSLNVPYKSRSAFNSAGYADIVINSSYTGGLVRQYGNFSFSRVFQAGHEVPAYQPETAYQLFRRAIFGMDMATGKQALSDTYSTTGPANSANITNVNPGVFPEQCYILAPGTCSPQQIQEVMGGAALIHDYIVIDGPNRDLFPGVGNSNAAPTGTATAGSGGLVPTGGSTGTTGIPSSNAPAHSNAASLAGADIGVVIGMGLAGWSLVW